MKKKPTSAPAPVEPTEDDIAGYAYHLYEQSGRRPGRDVDNWLEAKACIMSNIPAARSHTRLHHHLTRKSPRPPAVRAFSIPNPKARNLAS